MSYKDKPAFRCKNCGHLEAAAHAGENSVPYACSVCGKGVTSTPAGVRTFQPENWEVLADLKPDELAKIGLNPEGVARHVPFTKVENNEPKFVFRDVQENLLIYEEPQ